MANNIAQTGPAPFNPIQLGWRKRGKHPVRLSALLALKEALLQEAYEECREMIAIAEEFGATETEVYLLLEDPRRNP